MHNQSHAEDHILYFEKAARLTWRLFYF